MEYMRNNGLPPKKASCVQNGYWVRAAIVACNVKYASKKLAKAVSNYWHANVHKFRFLIEAEIVSCMLDSCVYYNMTQSNEAMKTQCMDMDPEDKTATYESNECQIHSIEKEANVNKSDNIQIEMIQL